MAKGIREVQDLFYDGKRLFCPVHPDRQLVEGGGGVLGKFSKYCSAEVGAPEHRAACIEPACMKNAIWNTREEMDQELGQLRLELQEEGS